MARMDRDAMDAWVQVAKEQTARAERAEAAIQRARAVEQKLWEQVAQLKAMWVEVRAEMDPFDRGRMNGLGEAHGDLLAALDGTDKRTLAERLQRAEEARDVAQAGRNIFVERARRAEAAISYVRALHRPERNYVYRDDGAKACGECGDGTIEWPCPTIAALDSTDPDGGTE